MYIDNRRRDVSAGGSKGRGSGGLTIGVPIVPIDVNDLLNGRKK